MEPVGQKPPFGDRIPSLNALPEEFLLRLVDLSRASLPGPKISLLLPADLLARLFGPSSVPVRFELRSPEARKALEALLDKSMAGVPQPRLSLEVAREGNRLLWSVRGKGGEILLTSPLLAVRPGVIPLEGTRTPPAESSLLEPPLPLLLSPGPIMTGPLSREESVTMRGGALALPASAHLASGGPVAAWPAFISGRTPELSVRWMPEEERKGAFPGRSGGNVVFSLDIPWKGGSDGQPSSEKVRLTGFFGPDGLTLMGRNLPEDFLLHFGQRQEILSESLRIFPGVELTVRLGGRVPEREEGRGE